MQDIEQRSWEDHEAQARQDLDRLLRVLALILTVRVRLHPTETARTQSAPHTLATLWTTNSCWVNLMFGHRY